MRLDRFASIDDWLAVAGGFLAEREAEHNLMLGLSSTLRRNPDAYGAPPYLVALRDGKRVVAAALRTPPYNLILSEIDDLRALDLLVSDLGGELLPGVVGPPEPVAAFAEQWASAVGGSWAVALEERIYRLAQVREPERAPGGARLAISADRDLLERWLIEFGIETLNDADAERVRLGLDDWEQNGGRRYWIWEADGRPVSLVGAGGETPNGIRIGPVYTPMGDRGKGYASNLTAWVSHAVINEGRRFCFLYTDLANPTANKIYQAIGYEPVTDARMVAFAS